MGKERAAAVVPDAILNRQKHTKTKKRLQLLVSCLSLLPLLELPRPSKTLVSMRKLQAILLSDRCRTGRGLRSSFALHAGRILILSFSMSRQTIWIVMVSVLLCEDLRLFRVAS